MELVLKRVAEKMTQLGTEPFNCTVPSSYSRQAIPFSSSPASTRTVFPREALVKQATVALCINGLQRTLLSGIVRSSFENYVIGPSAESGRAVDTFIAVSDQDPSNKSLVHEIQQAYSAVAVTLLAKAPFSMPCHLVGLRDKYGPGYPLVQWRSIEAC